MSGNSQGCGTGQASVVLLVLGLQPSAHIQGELWGLVPTQGIHGACWVSLVSRAGTQEGLKPASLARAPHRQQTQS